MEGASNLGASTWSTAPADLAIWGALLALCVLALYAAFRPPRSIPRSILYMLSSFLFLLALAHLFRAGQVWWETGMLAWWAKLLAAIAGWGAVGVAFLALARVIKPEEDPRDRTLSAQMQTMAADLERTRGELEVRNRELDEFTYIASHDLQAPVRAIINFLDFLREDLGPDIPPKAQEDIDRIHGAARRMRQMVHDLLALSRSSLHQVKPEPVPLGDCAQEAVKSLATEIEEKHAQVEIHELPVVEADRSMMTRVFQNMVGNSIKFCPEGVTPHVQIVCEHLNGKAVIAVKDNGIGLDTKHEEKVFAPFRKLHGRGDFGGSGIGLAVCKKVIERHGGRIWVESEPGNGCSFRFTLGSKD